MGAKLTPVAETPPSKQDGQLGLQRNVGVPTVTSRLERSAGLLPYHQRGKLGGLRRCPCFVDSFITKVGL